MLTTTSFNTTFGNTTQTAGIGALTGRDASGFEIFSAGSSGVAHDIAHQMLDRGDFECGHQTLGAWLDTHEGSGSEWVHLHWHMGVFELGLGYWDQAFRRCCDEIMPAVVAGRDALTDAPAMLWRLRLAATRSVELPWEAVRCRALDCLQAPGDPYVELHHALALAGAGDRVGLEEWLGRTDKPPAGARELVRAVAEALSSAVAGNYQEAGWKLSEAVPRLHEVGGSRAQNELFADIEACCWKQV